MKRPELLTTHDLALLDDHDLLRELERALVAREHVRAEHCARILSVRCDQSGVLAKWLVVRPLLDAIASAERAHMSRLP